MLRFTQYDKLMITIYKYSLGISLLNIIRVIRPFEAFAIKKGDNIYAS